LAKKAPCLKLEGIAHRDAERFTVIYIARDRAQLQASVVVDLNPGKSEVFHAPMNTYTQFREYPVLISTKTTDL
jgi:hypothetical protein